MYTQIRSDTISCYDRQQREEETKQGEDFTRRINIVDKRM